MALQAIKGADTTATVLGRGTAAGLAGTAVMTAFQVLVEMPLTGREESYAPAKDWATDLGEKLLLAEATGLIYERLDPNRG